MSTSACPPQKRLSMRSVFEEEVIIRQIFWQKIGPELWLRKVVSCSDHEKWKLLDGIRNSFLNQESWSLVSCWTYIPTHGGWPTLHIHVELYTLCSRPLVLATTCYNLLILPLFPPFIPSYWVQPFFDSKILGTNTLYKKTSLTTVIDNLFPILTPFVAFYWL